ncbi:MAG: hypothetical protein WB902_21820 [Acetobacteraceae bacterium]
MLKSRRRARLGPHSSNRALASLDGRTTLAKIMRGVAQDLLGHLGDDPTPPQRLLVQAASIKAARLAMLADAMLTAESIADGSDHHLLAWANSLRLDLISLGLERREKPTLHLASYLARAAPATAATDATAAAPAETPVAA